MKTHSLKEEKKQIIDEMIYSFFASISLEELIIIESQLRFWYLWDEDFEKLRHQHSELEEIFKKYLKKVWIPPAAIRFFLIDSSAIESEGVSVQNAVEQYEIL